VWCVVLGGCLSPPTPNPPTPNPQSPIYFIIILIQKILIDRYFNNKNNIKKIKLITIINLFIRFWNITKKEKMIFKLI
jgi:hypothetical protein